MPPSKTDIVADMRASPLYGRNPLFTRMTDGIALPVVIAQSRDDIGKVLDELRSGDIARFLDNDVDVGNQDSVNNAASIFSKEMRSWASEYVRNPGAADKTSLVEIGVMAVIVNERGNKDFSRVLGPLKDKLDKLAVILGSQRAKDALQVVASLGLTREDQVLAGLKAMQDGDNDGGTDATKELEGHIMAGARAGLAEAAGLDTRGKVVSRSLADILMRVEEFVVTGYIDKLRTDRVTGNIETPWAVEFGRNIAILLYIIMNKDTFSTSRQAVEKFGLCYAALARIPPHFDKWINTLGKGNNEMKRAVGKFSVFEEEEEDETPRPETKGEFDNRLKEAFRQGVERLHPVNSDIMRVAEAFAAWATHALAGKPTVEQAIDVGTAFGAALSIFSKGVGKRSENDEFMRRVEALSAVWPDWLGVIKRSRSLDAKGEVKKMADYLDATGFDHNIGFSNMHYRLLFDMTYKKFEEKVLQALNAGESANKCPNDTQLCGFIGKMKEAIGSDNLLLSRPAKVGELVGKNSVNIGVMGMAEIALDYAVTFEPDTKVNGELLERVSNDIILRIGAHGSGSRDPNSWINISRDPTQPHGPMSDQHRKNKEDAEKASEDIGTWAKPETIVFGSAMMWLIARAISTRKQVKRSRK